jgi:hypothetical protein
MIQSLSYGAANLSIEMRRSMVLSRNMDIDPVELTSNWGIKIDKNADPKAISRSLFNHALEQSKKGYESFSDELLNLATLY